MAAVSLKARADLIASRIKAWQTQNQLFYDGDHWQQGAGWSGQKPLGQSQINHTVLSEIARLFVSSNVIGEIVDRFANTLIGEEPAWSIDPRDPNILDEADGLQGAARAALETLIDQTNAAMTSFWDSPSKRIMEHLTNATAESALNGRSYLRLFIPAALIKDGAIATDLTFDRAVESIWIQSVPATKIAHSLNDTTMDMESDRVYESIDAEGKKQIGIEHQRIMRMIVSTGPDGGDVMIEDYQGEPITLIEILHQQGDSVAAVGTFGIPMRGHLLTFELRLRSQVDDSIRRQQMALNVVLTMMQHNILGAGFFERILFNAQMPGKWEKASDPNHPAAINGYILVPGSYETGLGVLNSLVGQPIRDEKGAITNYTTPSIWTHEPSPVSTFADSESAYRKEILASAGQLHAVLSGDAVASGESRQQALADFLARIKPAASQVQTMVRWLLESTVYLAGYLSNDNSARHMLKATVKLKLSLPPLGADAQRVINELVKDGTISQETGLAQLPYIDDPEAELSQIESERENRQASTSAGLASGMLSALERTNSASVLTQPIPAAAPAIEV